MATFEDTEKNEGRRRERGSISSEQIIEGALKLARDVTIEGLSMPKLAQSLGIGVTSIYWYFRSKEDLLDELTAAVTRQFHDQMGDFSDLPWPDYLMQHFIALHKLLTSDEVMCDLLFFRNSKFSVNALEHIWPQIDKTLQVLVAAGFTEEEAIHNHFLLSHYTRGSIILWRLIRKAGKTEQVPARVPATFDARRFPVLASVGEWHSLRGTTRSEFEGGLRVAVEGMKAIVKDRQG